MSLTRRPLFWIAHSIFFLLCLFYTLRNFHQAFPFVELDVKMDRKAALREASDLARKHAWFPKTAYREAVTFDVDSSTQNFIELEAGGPQALAKVLKEGIYSPYAWRVRHFAEGQTNETQVRFTPEGKPSGFSEKISEDDPGAALSAADARAIAEKSATEDWGVDLKSYHLVEKSSETRKSKRVDHSFIYERNHEQVGEGKYRLKLDVSGDHFTELESFIKVPDAFFRRYQAMRSANGTIASLAGAVVVLLYGIGFCGIGLFLLARIGWVQWRVPVALAGVIAGLHFLDDLNRLPLEWMDYDTAISTQAFAVRHVASALLGGLFDFVMVVIPLIAAETLSRRAFPNQPQLWRVFSRDAASSKQIIGRVLGALLFVGFHFAWVVWIYQVGSQRLGWWNPSELLFHPDELATYFPWLTSVANSLHAGVWEECLFRGVPLAAAALIGSRYGRRGAWIAAAFVLQMVVFGSAHASYPTQPSYARLVELLVPSAVFGGVYLAFGLLPGILMHYTYDVTLFAMPLFLSSGRTAITSRVIVILLSGLPLWIPLVARFRSGSWRELAASLYNRAWTPATADARHTFVQSECENQPRARLSQNQRKWLAGAGIAGLCLWAGIASFHSDAPGLKLSQADAIRLGRQTLTSRGIHLGPEWQAFAIADGTPGEEVDFVWRTSGADAYRSLLGSYLEPPHWVVRFARFEGDLVERAEERQVYILGSGQIERVRHELPESRPGATLEEGAARAIATRVLADQYGLAPAQVLEVSSNQYQLPARRDWIFTWRDPAQTLKQGEARISVKVAGDEVVGYRRYIHVPEEWLRAERSRRTTMSVVKMLAGAIFALLTLWICFLAFRGWIHGQFDRRTFGLGFLGILVASALVRFGEFHSEVAQFNTAQSWSSQVLRSVISDVLLILVGAAISALCLGRVHAPQSPARTIREPGPWLGYSAGAWLAAFGAVAASLGKAEHPTWRPSTRPTRPILGSSRCGDSRRSRGARHS